jgi:outer membrane receptor protein involved in Fe transport
VKFGSFGYVSPFLRYEQNFSNKFAFSAVGEYTYAENDYPYELQNGTQTIHDYRTNSRMNSGHGELNFLWNINKTNRLTGKVYYYDNDRQLPGQVRYYTNLSGENLRDRNFFGQVMYQTYWDDKWSLKWISKFNWSASIYKDDLMAGGINDASYWQREVYTTVALLYTPDEHWSFDYSADYAFNNLNGSSWRTVMGHPYRHTVLQSATAKYHIKRLTILGRLLYSLYLNEQKDVPQVERTDIQKNSASNMRRLSPSVSLSYRLFAEQDMYVRASYKNIFRSPTFNESYYYHYGSPNLKPETTDQYNVGITFSHTRLKNWQLYMTLDGYYNHVKDMIVAVPYNMFVWTCVNVGKVYIYGIDATLKTTYRFSPRYAILFSGNYSYQKVENRFNPESPNYKKQIAYMPEHTGSAALTFENPWVNVSVHGVRVSSRWPNNDHYDGTMIEGYTDIGLTAYRQLTFGRHQLEARFDLKNMFDEQYEIVYHYPMPRRSYQVTLNYKF